MESMKAMGSVGRGLRQADGSRVVVCAVPRIFAAAATRRCGDRTISHNRLGGATAGDREWRSSSGSIRPRRGALTRWVFSDRGCLV